MGQIWQAVLFDAEGVIVHPDLARAEASLEREWPGMSVATVQAARNSEALYPLWEEYSCGRMRSEAYWAAILESVGITAEPDSVEAMQTIQAATAWARLDQAVLDLVRSLRTAARVRVGVLSNSAPDYDDAIEGFERVFDCAHFSHRTGRRKPEPEAFLGAAAALGATPDAIVFVDDKSRNRLAAEALGMHALAFTSADALAADLTALGLAAGPVR